MIIATSVSFWYYLEDTTVKAPVGLDALNLIYTISLIIFIVCFIRITYYVLDYAIAHKDKILRAKEGIKYIFMIIFLCVTGYKILGICKGTFEIIMNL